MLRLSRPARLEALRHPAPPADGAGAAAHCAAMAGLQHIYRYEGASTLALAARPALHLATSLDDGAAAPPFFEGSVRSPRRLALLLTALQQVVAARYFTPANTLARAIALADPVVTAGDGWLRFEGFSSCCSSYARVDLQPEAFDSTQFRHGSTNVDFNAPMRSALARLRDEDGLHLSVGREALALRTAHEQVVERRVDLPLRWLRGLVEVQAYQAAMAPRFTLDGVSLLRFVRQTGAPAKLPLWLGRGAGGLYTSTQPIADGVRVHGLQRLRVLEPLLPLARAVSVHADDARQATAWVLELDAMRFTLVLSALTWRGFSGEGQALRALLRREQPGVLRCLAAVRAQLAWQAQLDAEALARRLRAEPADVADALRILGASGLVGFDLLARRYFHRVLPFDLSGLADMHPRLADAQALLQQGAVQLAGGPGMSARVQSGDVEYLVREVSGQLRCNCPWFAQHQGERGPCKHVLAVEGRLNQATA